MTAKWVRLNINDLRLVLAEDEIQKLDNLSKSTNISAIINDQLDMVSDLYRGALAAKGFNIDIRAHFTAPEYRNIVLNYARWQIWTRFPSTEDFALTKPRENLFEEAQEYLKDPKIGVSTPDYSDDPDLSGRTDLTAYNDGALSLPFLKFNSWDSGFMSNMYKNSKIYQ